MSETVLSERRTSLSQRGIAAIVAIVIELLLLLGLIALAPKLLAPPRPRELPNTFSLSPSKDEQAQTSHAAHRNNAQRAQTQPPTPRPPQPTPPNKQPVTPPLTQLPGVIPLNLASSDVSNIHAPPGPQAQESADEGDGKDSTSAYGPGAGPGGQRLYKAEWYRHPTDAELNYYLPKTGAPPGAFALIACQTIDHYHVDNCRQLDEGPEGSGLARAMRQAAWQFLVRPPRVGGHVMVGAWVSIRIDFTRQRSDSQSSGDDSSSSGR